jgi:peptide/nickel transport system permease protein
MMPDRLPLRGDEDVSVALAARLRARGGRTLQLVVTRSSCVEATTRDFLRTARAMGLAERVVAWRHVLRNALPLAASIVGLHARLRRGT